MTDTDQVARKTDRTFILVCANFTMLAILFLGIGYVVFQAATLVTGLKQDLARAEQQVVKLQERIEGMNTEAALQNIMTAAVKAVREELSASTPGSEAIARLAEVPEKVDATAQAIQDIGEKVQDLDADQIAQRVAYHMLKGMGQGFDQAAESRKPEGL